MGALNVDMPAVSTMELASAHRLAQAYLRSSGLAEEPAAQHWAQVVVDQQAARTDEALEPLGARCVEQLRAELGQWLDQIVDSASLPRREQAIWRSQLPWHLRNLLRSRPELLGAADFGGASAQIAAVLAPAVQPVVPAAQPATMPAQPLGKALTLGQWWRWCRLNVRRWRRRRQPPAAGSAA